MPRVVVVGGGIAGIAAAHRVASSRGDVDVLLLEASDRIGGKLRRVQLAEKLGYDEVWRSSAR